MGYDTKNVPLTYTDRAVLRELAEAELRRFWRPNPQAPRSMVRNALNKLRWAEDEERGAG